MYILDQFFISNTAKGPINDLAQMMVDRISDAIDHGKPFKCVVLCTQPEDLGPKMVPVVQLQYATICRGVNSMVRQLRERHPGIDVRVVNVDGRNHAKSFPSTPGFSILGFFPTEKPWSPWRSTCDRSDICSLKASHWYVAMPVQERT